VHLSFTADQPEEHPEQIDQQEEEPSGADAHSDTVRKRVMKQISQSMSRLGVDFPTPPPSGHKRVESVALSSTRKTLHAPPPLPPFSPEHHSPQQREQRIGVEDDDWSASEEDASPKEPVSQDEIRRRLAAMVMHKQYDPAGTQGDS
jgi:hypothetical protein